MVEVNFKNVSKKYEDGFEAVKDLNLDMSYSPTGMRLIAKSGSLIHKKT